LASGCVLLNGQAAPRVSGSDYSEQRKRRSGGVLNFENMTIARRRCWIAHCVHGSWLLWLCKPSERYLQVWILTGVAATAREKKIQKTASAKQHEICL